MQSPQRQVITNDLKKHKHWSRSIADDRLEEQLNTPYLVRKLHNESQINWRNSFLDKNQDLNSNEVSNHLYKYTNKILKRDQYNDVIKNVISQPAPKNNTELSNNEGYKVDPPAKRVPQTTPISSNDIKSSINSKFESFSNLKKYWSSNIHSSGGASLTTATSNRNLLSKIKISCGYPSKTRSTWESNSTDTDK